MTARIARGCQPLRAATPSSSVRPFTAMLRPSMIMSLTLYRPSCLVSRQSTLIAPSVDCQDLRLNSLETIAPSGSSRLPITLGHHDVVLEQPEEFLLLLRRHDLRKAAENKMAEAWDVEVLVKQFTKSRLSLRRRGIPGDNLELVAKIVDKCGWVRSGRNGVEGASAPAIKATKVARRERCNMAVNLFGVKLLGPARPQGSGQEPAPSNR